MTAAGERDPLEAAAILKLKFLLDGRVDDPAFRFVYFGVLREYGLTDSEVESFLKLNHDRLVARVRGREA